MPPGLKDYLDPASAPPARPSLDLFSDRTRALHASIDASIRRHGIAYLHPTDPTLQLDMLGSRHMQDWQERKVERMFSGEEPWSDLHQFYARYGVETSRELMRRLRSLEGARGVILTDCGMQAVALTFDILARPGGHALVMRGVYNKSRRYLEWLGSRLRFDISVVDEGDMEQLDRSLRPQTFVVFGETYTNPLLRALDPGALEVWSRRARAARAPALRLVVDNTIATPWGLRRPLLEFPGIDIVVASGTKALGGQDRDLWGYIASRQVDFVNETMDLQAMRGGALDWRRARAILEGLALARERFEERCRSARRIAEFLRRHPRVESVFHPSLPDHPDRAAIERHYALTGSLLAFKIRGASEESTRHFADVLATCVIPRYAGSFDGLATKVNHHRTVSEYFTATEELERAGIDRIVRVAVGIEAVEDIVACLNWALWHFEAVTPDGVLDWQRAREQELGLRSER